MKKLLTLSNRFDILKTVKKLIERIIMTNKQIAFINHLLIDAKLAKEFNFGECKDWIITQITGSPVETYYNQVQSAQVSRLIDMIKDGHKFEVSF